MRKTKRQGISRRRKNHKGRRYSRKHRGGQTPNPYIPAVSTTGAQQPFTLNSLSNWFIKFGNKLKEGARNITAKARQEWQKGVQLIKNAQAQQQQLPQPQALPNMPPPPNPVQNMPTAAAPTPAAAPIQVGNTTTAYGGKRRRRRTRKRRRHRSRK